MRSRRSARSGVRSVPGLRSPAQGASRGPGWSSTGDVGRARRPPGNAATAVTGRVGSTKAIRSVGSPARSGTSPRVIAATMRVRARLASPTRPASQVVEGHRGADVHPQRRLPPGRRQRGAQLAPVVGVLQHLVGAPLADRDDRHPGLQRQPGQAGAAPLGPAVGGQARPGPRGRPARGRRAPGRPAPPAGRARRRRCRGRPGCRRPAPATGPATGAVMMPPVARNRGTTPTRCRAAATMKVSKSPMWLAARMQRAAPQVARGSSPVTCDPAEQATPRGRPWSARSARATRAACAAMASSRPNHSGSGRRTRGLRGRRAAAGWPAARSRSRVPLTPGTRPPRRVQHLAQHGGPVGHDAVDPEVEQAVDLVGVVDGPDVHLQAAVVGGGQEPLVDQRAPAQLQRHLGAAGLDADQAGGPGGVGGQPQRGHALGVPARCTARAPAAAGRPPPGRRRTRPGRSGAGCRCAG